MEEGTLKYRRVVLKLSGEALMGNRDCGYEPEVVKQIVEDIIEAWKAGVQLAIVVGGGNIFRGQQAKSLGIEDVAQGHYMGMLATVINAMALQGILERYDVPTRVMSAIRIEQICEPYIRRRAIRHLERGYIVILAGGTGNPFFSTDTAAALRAIEIGAEVVLKATRVDGIYTADPEKVEDAKKLDYVTYDEAYEKNLQVMDMTAFTLCKENKIPIIVFDVFKKGNLLRVLKGEPIGTVVGD
ncbi:MAG: UMP kinase [Chlorobi bacterium]|nr:UMP kinase [Chlorobiota bacterium]